MEHKKGCAEEGLVPRKLNYMRNIVLESCWDGLYSGSS
jgi:hypothetical protein